MPTRKINTSVEFLNQQNQILLIQECIKTSGRNFTHKKRFKLYRQGDFLLLINNILIYRLTCTNEIKN